MENFSNKPPSLLRAFIISITIVLSIILLIALLLLVAYYISDVDSQGIFIYGWIIIAGISYGYELVMLAGLTLVISILAGIIYAIQSSKYQK